MAKKLLVINESYSFTKIFARVGLLRNTKNQKPQNDVENSSGTRYFSQRVKEMSSPEKKVKLIRFLTEDEEISSGLSKIKLTSMILSLTPRTVQFVTLTAILGLTFKTANSKDLT